MIKMKLFFVLTIFLVFLTLNSAFPHDHRGYHNNQRPTVIIVKQPAKQVIIPQRPKVIIVNPKPYAHGAPVHPPQRHF